MNLVAKVLMGKLRSENKRTNNRVRLMAELKACI